MARYTKATTGVMSMLFSQTRRISAAAGVGALLVLGFVPEAAFAERIAIVALAAIGFATALGWVELFVRGRPPPPLDGHVGGYPSWKWAIAMIGVALFSGLAIQAWFRPGTSIGVGDTVLPNGAAWISRMFEPWVSTGFSLGEPSQLPLFLPWGAALSVAHVFGGDAGV